MAVINEITEVLHKIEAKFYPNYLGRGAGICTVALLTELLTLPLFCGILPEL